MSNFLLKALGFQDKPVSHVDVNALRNSSALVAELDDGYISIDHYGEKGVRKSMEDECIICESLCKLYPQLPSDFDFTICGLFDGHGGRNTAIFAKENLLLEIASQIVAHLSTKNESDDLSFEYLFKKSVNTACRRLDTRIANEIHGCNDGSTALLLFFGKRVAYILNLGDSSAYLCRKIDSVLHSIPLNELHKPWSQNEKLRIQHYGGTIEGGRVNGILEVTRSFGDLQLKKYGVLCVGTFRKVDLDFNRDEFIILACDGFWSVFDANEACRKTLDFIKKEEASTSNTPQLKRVCKEMVNIALNTKRSQDNVTVLVVRFKPK